VARAVVEAPAAGLTLRPTWHLGLAQRTGGSDEVDFDGVFVHDDFVIDRQPIDRRTAPPPPGGWWLTVVAAYLGVGQASLDAALRYAQERKPSALGEPIATLPHIQQWLGEMQALLFGARTVLHAVARRWAQRPEQRAALAPQVAAAKSLVTNAVCQVTDIGLRVAGGFSLTPDVGLERPFRDARGGLFMPPQDDLAHALLARAALSARVAETEIR
jgi:alkylation response protein AidB-like acyl-CoA dehydrogenase